MCGICFLRRGVHIKQHTFKFNFFEDYVSAEHMGADRSWAEIPLNQHVMKGNLILRDIDIRDTQRIRPRGPDSFQSILYTDKGIIEGVPQHQIMQLKEGCSFCCQSVLRLRGEQPQCKQRKGVLLYNGEIYLGKETLSPKPYESDTEWLYELLEAIPDNKLYDAECILSLLRQVRGDFAILYQRNDTIYIAKDEFGKKSLLLGFEQNGFVVSSLPLGEYGKREPLQEAGDEEDNGKDWMAKYKAQYTAASTKKYYELPKNSLIQVKLNKDSAVWNRSQIYENWFVRSALDNKSENSFEENVECLTIMLLDSVTELVSNIGAYQRHFHDKEFVYQEKGGFDELTNCHVAVLFSGGLDSCLIAKLLDLVLPKSASIDLVNLVFAADAPDRKTALQAVTQLRGLSPRQYNLILMNKTLEDIEAISEEHLQRIYPKDTHMDFNISAVLHSACQLAGVSDTDGRPVTSRAKVILSGLGADEIFCGYSRYRVAFNRGGYAELERQMNFDLERLWLRNLGRDDRATSDRSKEVRYPFLYSPLVKYIKTSVRFQSLTDFTKPKGSGDKVLLRKIAQTLGLEYNYYQLRHTSGFKKTAIQFGTRLAKQSNVKNFGSNRKGKGTTVYQKQS